MNNLSTAVEIWQILVLIRSAMSTHDSIGSSTLGLSSIKRAVASVAGGVLDAPEEGSLIEQIEASRSRADAEIKYMIQLMVRSNRGICCTSIFFS